MTEVAPEPIHALALLGSDIANSPSPTMHNAALIALGRPERYALNPCAPQALDAFLDDAPKRLRGMNITAPYKIAAAERFAAVSDDDARDIGVINTVCFDGGRARLATNTDVFGLTEAWRRGAVHIEGRSAVVIGTGATATSAVFALHKAGAESVCVLGRNPARTAHLLNFAHRIGLRAEPVPAPDAYLAVLAVSALDDPPAWIAQALERKGVVHDVRYRGHIPARNAALGAGHFFIDGRTMLVAQAARSLELFLDISPDPVIAAAMAAALRGHRETPA